MWTNIFFLLKVLIINWLGGQSHGNEKRVCMLENNEMGKQFLSQMDFLTGDVLFLPYNTPNSSYGNFCSFGTTSLANFNRGSS